jgi:trans-aconitate 2-methyltransferase
MRSEYSFGDSQRAAARLALLARVFAEPSRAFLAESGLPGCELAVDLGCGPGLTTRLLADTLGCRRTVGLDASPAFVAQARSHHARDLEFQLHDASRVPFPTGPPDLAYARLLCSHLSDPESSVRVWRESLRPGGRLLLEDVEWIRTRVPGFRRYLGLIESLLSARGHCLYVGARLAAFADGALASRVRVHPVDPRAAAELFSLNLGQLREQGSLCDHLGGTELDALAAELSALRRDGGPPITWGLRQLALEA